jgi:endo-1,3-1,4-beta-glycanase ExoK
MRSAFVLLGCFAVASCGFDPPPAGPSAVGGTAGAAGSSNIAGSAAPVGGTSGSSAGGAAMKPEAGTGGALTAGTSNDAAGAASGPFELVWRDDFDSFDADRWTKATHTFPENLAHFSAANVVVEDGLLKLRVTKSQSGDKPYTAAEIYSVQDFKFGRFEGRIKFCAGSGLVSSLFTYKEDVERSWQEIDIEHLGNLPMSIQYNLIYGTLAERKYQPKVVTLAYNPTSEFHDYAIEWKPDGITFYIDGQQTHHDMQATIQDPAKLRMNAWPTDNSVTSFAGPLDATAIPCEAQYDWVQVFSYEP